VWQPGQTSNLQPLIWIELGIEDGNRIFGKIVFLTRTFASGRAQLATQWPCDIRLRGERASPRRPPDRPKYREQV